MRNIFEYSTTPRFRDILAMYEKANTPEELEAARQHQRLIESSMTKEEKEAYDRSVIKDLHRMASAMDEDIADLQAEVIRKKMGDTPKFINLTQIARVYFGKSQSWLMQRINGNTVNGKEARFTPAEAKQLEAAFHDLGNKLLAVAL